MGVLALSSGYYVMSKQQPQEIDRSVHSMSPNVRAMAALQLRGTIEELGHRASLC